MAAPFKYYVLVVWCIFLLLTNKSKAWEAHFQNFSNFEPATITLHMYDTKTINLTLTGLNGVEQINDKLNIISSDTGILDVSNNLQVFDDIIDGNFSGQFNITAHFLGTVKLHVNITQNNVTEQANQTLTVIIIREEKTIDRIFTASIVALVSILYINFGAALDLGKVKEILVRPIGPLIAFICQFLFMPLVSVKKIFFFFF